jgi:hypothetical protein
MYQLTGELHGVLGVGYFLDVISKDLKNFTYPDENSDIHIMIMQKDGRFVASNIEVPSSRTTPNMSDYLYVWELDNCVLRTAASELQDEFGSLDLIPFPITRYVPDCNGVVRTVNAFHFEGQYNLEWIIITSVNNEKFSNVLVRSNVISISVSIAVVVLVALLSILLGFCITVPLKRAAQQLRHIAHLDMNGVHKKSYLHRFKLSEFRTIDKAILVLTNGVDNFKRFLPQDVVREVLRKNREAKLEVVHKNISVMFVDIQGFTEITEEKDPSVLVTVLQNFFTITNGSVDECSGTFLHYFNSVIRCC